MMGQRSTDRLGWAAVVRPIDLRVVVPLGLRTRPWVVTGRCI